MPHLDLDVRAVVTLPFNIDTFGRLGYDVDQVQDVPHKILWQIPHSDELVDLKNPKWRKENQNPVA